MKEYWTITYHNQHSPEVLECVHKDIKSVNIFYYTMNILPEFFISEYEIDFVMIMHETKTVRIYMKEKEKKKGGTL